MSKSKIFKKVAPIAGMVAPFIPGIGVPLAAGLGALGGYASGGGLKGALLGGAGGAIGAGGLGTVSKLGVGGMGPQTAGTGLLGKLTSGSGAFGTAVRNVGSGLSSLGSTGGGLVGKIGTGLGKALTSGGISSPQAGDQQGGFGGGNLVSNIYSGLQGDRALKGAQQAQLRGNTKALKSISPFLQGGRQAQGQLSTALGVNGEDPEDIMNQLRNTPGYQFQQEQGQQAIDRSMAARGGLLSGRAVRAGQEYGQGLADQSYQNYIQNLQQQAGQGLSAGTQAGLLQQTGGDISANSIIGRSNLQNQTLADILNPQRYRGY